MAVFLVLMTLLAFGTWGTLRRWQGMARVQLALDRCVGRQALALQETMASIELSNHRIREFRAALAAIHAAGPLTLVTTAAAEALTTLLWAEVVHQEGSLLKWRARQGRWLLERGCLDLLSGTIPRPLPSLGWQRPPEDPIGPLPLVRESVSALQIELNRSPRRARAEVSFAESPGGRYARWS